MRQVNDSHRANTAELIISGDGLAADELGLIAQAFALGVTTNALGRLEVATGMKRNIVMFSRIINSIIVSKSMNIYLVIIQHCP